MNRYSYKNLNVYQEAKMFVVAVYKLLDSFPDTEKFALCNQIRRAAISVTSNIAEGVSKPLCIHSTQCDAYKQHVQHARTQHEVRYTIH